MTTHQLFLQALEAGLRGRTLCLAGIDPAQWEALFELARSQSLLPLILEAVYPSAPDPQVLGRYRPLAMRELGGQTRRTQEFLALYRHLAREGHRPLVVKGIVLRRLYPQPDARPSGDEDLWAGEPDYLPCHGSLLAWGMEPSDPQADPRHTGEMAYGRRGSELYIELHRDLFPPELPGETGWDTLFAGAMDRAVTVEEAGVELRTLDHTDHVTYLILHSYKHFLHSGFGIRQVCDLIRFTEVYGDGIRWDTVWQRCCRVRAERFAGAMYAIGLEYLGFSPDSLPQPWRDCREDPGPMLADLLGAGTFGDSSMSRRHSANITLGAARGKKNGLAASLFPSAASLAGRYPYLREKPWLLPWAWVSRMAAYAHRSGGDDEARQSLRIGRERVALMRYYGIVD